MKQQQQIQNLTLLQQIKQLCQRVYRERRNNIQIRKISKKINKLKKSTESLSRVISDNQHNNKIIEENDLNVQKINKDIADIEASSNNF